MKKIPLTHGKYALVDNEDFNWLNKHKWYARHDRNTFYALTCKWEDRRRKTLYMHRLIAKTPLGGITDHIDGDGLNNQRNNLRICSHRVNMLNRRALNERNTSGYTGVCWNKRERRWQSSTRNMGRIIFLGYYDTKEQAAKAYQTYTKKWL